MARMVQCVYLKKEAEALDRAPWPGELGKKLMENISKPAWSEWMSHQTMLINEKQLNPMNKEHRNYLAEQMEKFLFGEGADKVEGFRPE
jgi:Fe-S cluster biosynthesis and repair protein YggX